MVSFNLSLKRPACLATLNICDTTKRSVCGSNFIYIYIYIYIYQYVCISIILFKIINSIAYVYIYIYIYVCVCVCLCVYVCACVLFYLSLFLSIYLIFLSILVISHPSQTFISLWPSGRVSSSAFCGCWFNLQWWRSWYALLMRLNKVETAVQCSACRCLPDFLVMIIYIYIYTYIRFVDLFVLQRINRCRLFNAQSYLYMHISNIWFVNDYFIGTIFKRVSANLFSYSQMATSIAIQN